MAEDDVTLFGKLKSKLIDAKQKWAEDGRLLTGPSASLRAGKVAPRGERLPPGQRLVETWPVLDLGVQPEIPTHAWRLFVDGAVEEPMDWKWGAFTDLPRTTLKTDIHCVTAWSRYDNVWEGVSARDLIALVKPKPDAQHVIFHSYDTYTTNVPLADFADDDVILAWSWNGEPIGREHGGPLRVVVPKLYFWKSAKWIKRIEFAVLDKPGFWEVRGYHNYGDPWREQRYDDEET
ncbi:MAG: sulfite oxidase-like oxidoreductase [Proteobacteria bacterium]|nr:sulfite oxidase-like oxidoreductase [Pseudomonadota bacterium]